MSSHLPDLACLSAASFIVLFSAYAFAQSYPSKPVRFVIPSAPGGSTDIVGRLVGQKLTASLGQTVVIENRPGAGGIIGTEVVSRAAPDGYTLLLAPGSHAINASLYRKLPFDTVKDFDAVIHICTLTGILVAHPSLPVRSVRELVAFARAKPGEVNFASAGSGTVTHLTGEMFKTMAKVDILHVPYRGSGPAAIDLLAGQVMLMFASMPGIIEHVKSGRLRVLAVNNSKRSALLPEVPTTSESGVPGFEASGWFGLLAPAGMPKDLVARLNTQIERVLGAPDIAERFRVEGASAAGGPPEKFGTFIREEITKWAKVVQASGARAD